MPDQVNAHSWPLIVLKIGGSVLNESSDIRIATHEIYRWVRRGYRVVAVVSARKGRTDELLGDAREFGTDPVALAQLCATGEHEAAALLGLACDRAGIASQVLDARTTSIRTRGEVLDGEPISLNAAAIFAALKDATVAIIPGFIGHDEAGNLTLLGRGGSDLSAIFIASVLGARCRLVKDVPALFDRDPSEEGAQRYARVSWQTLRAFSGKAIQAKAAACALRNRQYFEIAAPLSDEATIIGGEITQFAPVASNSECRCLDVTILGAGVVGAGVYHALQDVPEKFRVVSVLVRDVEKAVRAGIPRDIVHTSPAAALAAASDVVVEALGGIDPAHECICRALQSERDVVSANKAVISARWKELGEIRADQLLVHSASVGGAVPVLELLRETLAPIVKVEGILNGTTNWILTAVAKGMKFDAAVKRAQDLGFAEADPTRDLSGQDALDKLNVIAKAVLDVHAAPATLQTLSPQAIAESGAGVLRHVACIEKTGDTWQASVKLVSLAADHPLARVHNENNAVSWTTAAGDVFSVSGKGAGRWPTTQAVVADLLDVYAARVCSNSGCSEIAS